MSWRRPVLLGLLPLALLVYLAIGPRTVSTARLQRPFRVEVYQGGRPAFERPIAPDSAADRAIAAWLLAHTSDWRPTLVTYVPSRRIHGAGFNLNFTGKLVVLNYDADPDGKGRWRQVSRAVRDDQEIPSVFGRPDGRGRGPREEPSR